MPERNALGVKKINKKSGMKKKTLRRFFNLKQINDLTHMVKLNKNVLNVEWENKMNIRDILKIVLWILFALAVFMIIVGSILDKKNF